MQKYPFQAIEDIEREAFEEYVSNGGAQEHVKRTLARDTEQYHESSTQAAWDGWLERSAIAHQREAELTAEIARLRDELQLKCNPAEIATQVPDGWREVLTEVLTQAETWLDEARGCAPADVIGYTGWAERVRALLESAPQSANVPTSHRYELELPEGDSRRVQIWYSDHKGKNGVLHHHLCIAVYDEPEQPTTEESSPVDPLAAPTNGCAGFQGKPVKSCGVCHGRGCDDTQ